VGLIDKKFKKKQKRVFFWGVASAIRLAKAALFQSETLLTTTDTVPGLLSSICHKGFLSLNAIKKGRDSKPYIVLIHSVQQLHYFVDEKTLTPGCRELMKRCWPGPLTIICKAKPKLPSYVKSDQGTIALRCPKHEGLLRLLQGAQGLFSTSANLSGQQTPKLLKDVDLSVVDAVSYVIADLKEKQDLQPSTIIDVSHLQDGKKGKDRNITFVRLGAYDREEIERIYESVYKRKIN
jgi:tRNA threonylcarbamoyl adenosine modification protein (Sua5/YciO/YrdC/YwlC family)